MNQCDICNKGPVSGHTITKRGLAKKTGGIGKRNVRVNKRHFLPNLQPVTVLVQGTRKRIRVCSACIRSDRVTRAPYKPSRPRTIA